MKHVSFFLVFLMVWGCKEESVSTSDLHFLNGYWEINTVEFPDGNEKQYKVNPNIDFIYLENEKGFRKKVQPKFDGTYTTNNDSEVLAVHNQNGSITLRYKNGNNEWEEKLTQLDSLSFSVVNQEGLKYSYKRFQPISIPK
ncbi:hypothetical protein [Flagellimonas nanhaiensis]|uniref:Lipocalin-like domain-containing protein n=1 Tax=Flagellimonas nanhaiensis TaxID=2292706 RepID=A0A371JTE2_9FLAO|nr:hypothetical protein [Allomuricauda nanhaiensis]RDY61071.1 hypothetical protein DX873_02550 [Allomuricauda nanhaiensis]